MACSEAPKNPWKLGLILQKGHWSGITLSFTGLDIQYDGVDMYATLPQNIITGIDEIE